MTTHITWRVTTAVAGPNTTYGYWEDAKCFSIHQELMGHTISIHNDARLQRPARYVLKCVLPGFRPDLPLQASIADAQVFAERMLQRWVAKRGLLFKTSVTCTDAMMEAARSVLPSHCNIEVEELRKVIEAALQAREPHAPRTPA